MERIKCFPPVVDKNTKILILGTAPGGQSLIKKEYYANPTNTMWNILLTSLKPKSIIAPYKERIQFLLSKGIGLWDVIESCERDTSSDNKIKNAIINDFESFRESYPNIECILFNGGTPIKYWNKKYKRNYLGFQGYEMPSTSSANTHKSGQEKFTMWDTALGYHIK